MATQARQKWVGQPVLRKEDRRFLTGRGQYTDDLVLPGLAHVAFVRSPYPHARIVSVDVSAAHRMPGVITALTGAEVKELTDPFDVWIREPFDELRDYCMAVDTAKHAGEAVAAVVAETPYLALDAAERIEVEYEPLPAVASAEQAMLPDAPRVHPNLPSNVVWHETFHYGDVEAAFAGAAIVVKERLRFHRFTSAPLENTVVMAAYDPGTRSATVWSNNQRPILNLPFIAKPLRMPSGSLRFICPDIGGGFGIKNNSYPYLVAAVLLARKAGRPVKWVESRSEHLQGSTHGNEILFEGEMAFSKDGIIQGVRARALHDEGCYMRREPIGAVNFIRHATVGYTIRNLQMDLSTVVTNKAPVGPNRSYGKMQQCYLIERLIESGARALAMDPVEIRLKNFVQPAQMPYEASGCRLDGGDYPRMMQRAMELFDYEGARRERDRARQEGRALGIGVAMGMDGCPINASLVRVIDPRRQTSGDSEAASIHIDEMGGIVATTGSVSQGQGFETTVAQLVADELGVGPDDVRVLPGFDSATHAHTAFSGTYASRFAIVGAGAVQGAGKQLRDKIVKIAAHLLEAHEDDIELAHGRAGVRGTQKALTLREIAQVAWRDLARLPVDLEAGLHAHYVFRPQFDLPAEDNKRGNFSLTYSYGITLALVEIDPGTGKVKVLRLVVLDDFGRRLNPLIVEGQIHGAVGHQLGAALYEHLHYGEDGQLLASTYKDYWAPTAADFPDFQVEYLETPSTATPLGTRGGGEGGGAPLIAAVNAVDDALAPFGGHLTDSFLAPEAILRELQHAGG